MDVKFSIINISFIHWYDTKTNKDDNINKEQSTKNMVNKFYSNSILMDKVSYGADVKLSLQKEKGQQIYFKIDKSYEALLTGRRTKDIINWKLISGMFYDHWLSVLSVTLSFCMFIRELFVFLY